MKAKFLLFSILTLLVTSLSSCFIKRWFTPPLRYNDHRGVYKEKGLTPNHKAYLEAMGMNRHKKHHNKKKKVKTHKLKENHNKKGEDVNMMSDSTGQKTPTEQILPNGGQTTDSLRSPGQYAPAPEAPKTGEAPIPGTEPGGQQVAEPAPVPPADMVPAAPQNQDETGDKKGKKKKRSKKSKGAE